MSFNPFPVGTVLHVETCFGDHITGDVVSYEHRVKMLILNSYGKDKNGKKCCNKTIVNMNYCKNLEIIKEVPMPDKPNEEPARLNFKCLDKRYQQSVVQREALLRRRNQHATPRGYQLFNMLSKYFDQHELCWQLDEIKVLQHLTIVPPYRNCDIAIKQNVPKLQRFVQRLLERFNAQHKEGVGKVNKELM